MERHDSATPDARHSVAPATPRSSNPGARGGRPVAPGTQRSVIPGADHLSTPGSPNSPVIPAHAGISATLLTRLDAVLRGCLRGQPERLAALDAAIRAPLPLSTGVGVIGAGDAAPTGVVASLLTEVLAARRPHRVLGVGGLRQAPPTSGFGQAQSAVAQPMGGLRQAQQGVGNPALNGFRQAQPAEGVQPASELRPGQPAMDIARRATARTGEEATAGLERTASGAWRLDLSSPGNWWEAVAPISRFFDFVVTDWGTPATLDDARAASTVLLVVTAADRTGLQAGVDLRARLAGSGITALLAVHDTGGASRGLAESARVNGAMWLSADRGLDKLNQRDRGLGQPGRVPDRRGGGLGGLDKLDQRDPGAYMLDQRGGGIDRRARRLRYSTTVAALELAAGVVDAAVTQNHDAAVTQNHKEGAA